MSSIFILGAKGDPELWLVDTAKGTVQPLDGEANGGLDTDFVRIVQRMRESDFSVLKDVDVAVAAGSPAGFTSRQLTENE